MVCVAVCRVSAGLIATDIGRHIDKSVSPLLRSIARAGLAWAIKTKEQVSSACSVITLCAGRSRASKLNPRVPSGNPSPLCVCAATACCTCLLHGWSSHDRMRRAGQCWKPSKVGVSLQPVVFLLPCRVLPHRSTCAQHLASRVGSITPTAA